MNATSIPATGRGPRWSLHSSIEATAASLAAEVAERLTDAIATRGRASLAVPGGTTPEPFFKALATHAIDWSRVTVTLTDERWVPENDPLSNSALVRRSLLQGPAAAAQWHSLFVPDRDIHSALSIVESQVDAMQWPLDVVVLGMGLDGHVASLFPRLDPAGGDGAVLPGCPALHAVPGRRVTAAVAPNGIRRISLSYDALGKSRHLLLLIHGRAKQQALQQWLADPALGECRPVCAVLEAHVGPTTVYCAQDAV